MDLDLTGIGKLLLDLLCDIARQKHHLILGNILGLDHNADLASGLDGVAARNAGEALGYLLELFEALDVVFDVLAACAGTGGRDSVGCLNDAGDDRARLDIAVVRLDSVDDRFALFIPLADIDADGDVAALDLVVDGLADIVQKACALCRVDVDAELRCDKAGNVRHLDRVLQDILTVARAVLHAAEQLYELGIYAVDVRFEHRALALGLDGGVDLLLSLGDHFLDARRVDAPVGNELFKSKTRHLAANGVKARYGYRFGRIVDDKITACQRFYAADIAALAADDASLHLVVGEWYDGYGDFACMVCRAALDSRNDDLACAFLGLVFILGLDLLDLDGHFMRYLVLEGVDEVCFCLIGRVSRYLFEHFELALLDKGYLVLLIFDIGYLAGKSFVLALKGIGLAVKVFFLLLKASFLLLQVGTACLFFALEFRAAFVYFFLCLDESLTFLALGALYGIINYSFCFIFCTGYLTLGDFFAVSHAENKSYNTKSNDKNDC